MTTLKISLLGTPKVESPLRGELTLNNRKAMALLAYLVAGRNYAHNRESLLAMFWPNLPEANARNNLRVLWSQLTTLLDKDANGEPYLIGNRRELQFNPASQVTFDVAEFEEIIRQCDKHGLVHTQRHTCPVCQQHLLRLVELYRGEFLTGLSLDDCAAFDEWQFVQRERMHVQTLYALDDLALFFEHQQQYQQAENYARRQIEIDPLRERAHRQLMQLLLKQGQRTGALAQFEFYKSILAKELGVQPEPETLALYQRIKSGNPPPQAASPVGLQAIPTADDWLIPRSIRNLPEIATPFVGREDELDQLILRMREGEYRLFSIVGFGGMGKTRLAVQLIRRVAEHYRDGACFVSLAPLQQASEIPGALWATLNMGVPDNKQRPGDTIWAQTLAALKNKQILIVLDNFEHLLNLDNPENDHRATSEFEAVHYLSELLRQAPHVHILVTTRQQLNLQAEDVLRLGGLEIPHLGQGLEVSVVEKFASVRLFCNRAYRINKAFKLTPQNMAAVAQICQQLQGNPLAIELAAAWASALSCEALAAALKRNLDLLSTNMSDVPFSHRSMRAVFNHSWDMLSAPERQILKRLGVFRGGFTLSASTAIVDASPVTLTQLLHKSLVQSDGVTRYSLHEVVARFTREALAQEENRQTEWETQQRHSRYYLQFVADQESALCGRYPYKALQDILVELDNIREAWHWAVIHHEFESVAASTEGLNRFFTLAGLNSEAERAFSLALQQVPDTDAFQPLRLSLLLALSHVLFCQSRLNDAIQSAQSTIRLAQQIGDKRSEAYGELTFSRASFDIHEMAASRASIERSLQLADSLGDLVLQGDVLLHYGRLLLFWEDLALSEKTLSKAYQIEHALGNVAQEQFILVYLGVLESENGNAEQALAHLRAALALNPQTRSPSIESRSENAMGYALARSGQPEAAIPHHQRSQQLAHNTGELVQESHALHNLCTVCRKLNRLDQAEAYGREALRVAIEGQSVDAEAYAYLHLGYVFIALGRLDNAEEVFTRAHAEWSKVNQIAMSVECKVALAEIAFRRGNLDQAVPLLEAALTFYRQNSFEACDEPQEVYRTCQRVLSAMNDPRADDFSALLHKADTQQSKK